MSIYLALVWHPALQGLVWTPRRKGDIAVGILQFGKPQGGKKKGHRGGDETLETSDPDISPDGESVAFVNGNGVSCLHSDLTVRPLSDTPSYSLAIGNDCSSFAFAAFDDQGASNIFVRTGSDLILVTVGEGGSPAEDVPQVTFGPLGGPPMAPVVDMTPDGCFVTFVTAEPLDVDDGGLPDVYLRSFSHGNAGPCENPRDELTLVSRGIDVGASDDGVPGRMLAPTISDDGASVAFAVETVIGESEDGSGEARIFLWKRDEPQAPTLVAQASFSGGLQSDTGVIPSLPMVSANGDFVTFSLDDDAGVRQVYRWDDRETLQVSPDAASVGTGSFEPSISGDGRFVSFTSNAPLVNGDTNGQGDVFVWDAHTGELTRASVDEFGDEADARGTIGSRSSSVSADGTTVTFLTDSPSILESADVPDDAPGFEIPFEGNTPAPQVVRTQVVFEDLRIITGTGFRDELVGGRAEELIEGLGGPDRISGRRGDDRIFAGDGNDGVSGDKGNDLLDGGSGNDVIHGRGNLDRVKGREGNDQLFGNRGNDILDGGAGDDSLFGGRGRDSLEGGSGNDRLEGGGGADEFVYNRFSASVQDPDLVGEQLVDDSIGEDIIVDFEKGKDKIKLINFDFTSVDFEGISEFSDLTLNMRIRIEDGNTIIDLSDAFRDPFDGALGGANTITMVGVVDLVAEDFVFQ